MSGPLRGVNLGGWLVLEKWMTPSLFAGTDAIDEYTFMATPDAVERLRAHHETWITEADFAWLAGHGVDLVRLPVGHWVLADDPPYLGAPELLDAAMDWAAAYGLEVLLDLHAVSGSQNGQDHSGRVGPRAWYRERHHREHTHDALAALATRYGTHPALWGLELVNEPMDWRLWRLRHFPPRRVRPARRPTGPGHPSGVLRRVRAVAAAGESARQGGPPDGDRQPLLPGVLSVGRAPQHRVAHREGARRGRLIRWLSRRQPVVVGEWSGGLRTGRSAGTRRRSEPTSPGRTSTRSWRGTPTRSLGASGATRPRTATTGTSDTWWSPAFSGGEPARPAPPGLPSHSGNCRVATADTGVSLS